MLYFRDQILTKQMPIMMQIYESLRIPTVLLPQITRQCNTLQFNTELICIIPRRLIQNLFYSNKVVATHCGSALSIFKWQFKGTVTIPINALALSGIIIHIQLGIFEVAPVQIWKNNRVGTNHRLFIVSDTDVNLLLEACK